MPATHAHEAARKALSDAPSRSSRPVASAPAKLKLPEERLDELWARMAARYGHAWTSQYVGDPEDEISTDAQAIAYAEWAETLAGLGLDQLTDGLRADARRGETWPPSAPAFRAMCLRIPTLAAVKFEMGRTIANRSPFTRLVWSFIDSYVFGRTDTKHAERLIADAYELARNHVMGGGALPEPSPALTHQPEQRTPATPETAEAHLAEIKRTLGLGEEAAEPSTEAMTP